MKTSYSKAGTGMFIVMFLEYILPTIGIEVPEGTLASFVDSLAVTVGILLMVWGQIDRSDLKWGLFRKG